MKEILESLIQTIEATGGVLGGERGVEGCVADPEWSDLADVYVRACEALGRKPLIVNQTQDEEV